MKSKHLPSITSVSLIVLIGSFFYLSCSKERIEPKELNKYNSPNTYLDSKKEQEQEFIITSDTGKGPIIGKLGTKIYGSRKCLKKPNGDTVGLPYTIKLVELYTPSQMIYYRMPTVSGGTILSTDGEIRLRAFKDAEELQLKPDPCLAAIEMPNANPQSNMRVFYGFETGGLPDWTDNPGTLGVTTGLSGDFSTTSYGYSASVAKLGWINCDKLAGSASNSILSFTSTVDDLTNVAIFVYLPATKTVMQAYNLKTTNIPNGTAAKIIAIAVNGSNNLFSFYQSTTVNSNSQIEITMKSTTDSELTNLLNGL